MHYTVYSGTCIIMHVFVLQHACALFMLQNNRSVLLLYTSHSGLHLPTSHSHSDSAVGPPVTCVDTVTIHLHSQCSGACSDVQETAEVQS